MCKLTLRGSLSLMSAVGIVMLESTPASAQSVPTSSKAAVASPGAVDIGDIIVTARKRDERLQDVPVAVSILTSADIKRYSIQSIGQIATQTPSLIVGSTNSTGGGAINLRGVGSAAAGPGIDQAVSINIDGIQVSQANVLRLALLDLQRVEILKGPQTLFFGKNSTGGVISIVSADPTAKLEAMLRTGFEFEANKKIVEGLISGPLTSTLGVRIDAYYGNQLGYFRNDAVPIPSVVVPVALGGKGESTSPGIGNTHPNGPKTQEFAVRGTLQYQAPGGKFDAKLKLGYAEQHSDNGQSIGNQLVACGHGASAIVVALGSAGSRDCMLDRNVNEADAPASLAALSHIAGDGQPFLVNKQYLASLNASYRPSPEFTLNSVTGYYKLTEAVLANYGFGSNAYLLSPSTLDIRQFTEEVRASTHFHSFVNFVIGGYYQHVALSNANDILTDNPYTALLTGGAFRGQVLLTSNRLDQKTSAGSGFGQIILNVIPKVEIAGGGRYSVEDKSLSGVLYKDIFYAANTPIGLSRNKRSFNNFSPETTISYKPFQTLTLYGAYREGFKSGGFQILATAGGFGRPNAGDLSYGQELARGFEVGAKGSLADRQIVFDLSLFNFKYSGLQISAFNPTTFSQQVTNAGTARVKGVEASIQLRPQQISGLTLHTTVNYDHSRYIEFQNSPCYGGQSQSAGCNLIVSAAPGGGTAITPATSLKAGNAQNLSGRPLSRAPDWSGNIGGTFEQNVGGNLVFGFNADSIYSGSYYWMPEEDPRSIQHDEWRFNAGISLRRQDSRWKISLVGTNLTNVLSAVSGGAVTATGSGTGRVVSTPTDLQAQVGDPRAITLEAIVRF